MPDWTNEQKQVIDSREQNLLVAAAAGSGKTAVLVERIIRMLTEPGSDMDIDRLLVVTYTNAAAAEMKDKILRALEKALSENPGDPHLAAQLTRIHSAAISTIHHFCLSVIQSHFQELDLDPSFRVGDEGELQLLRKDTVEELIEDCYGALAAGERPEWIGADADLKEAIDSMETGRSDTAMADAILEIHTHACGYESIDEWLQFCRSIYMETQEEPAWKGQLRYRVMQELRDAVQGFRHLLAVNEKLGGPEKYADMLQQDAEKMEALMIELEQGTFEEIGKRLANVSAGRAPTIRTKTEEEERLKKRISEERKALYTQISAIRESYFYAAEEVMEADLLRSGNTIRILVDLTIEFTRRFQEAKRKRNLIDYADMEHYALEILTVVQDGKRIPGPVAAEYRNFFREVIVDEYQDSSFIQEAILNSVSGISIGRNNRFMVGDVKQSIYGFRQSRPEIFQEKYVRYAKEETAGCARINLTRNFRSDARVLECANAVFRRIMREEVGGVAYTEEQELVYGRGSFLPAKQQMPPTEVLLLNTSVEAEEGSSKREKIDARELEFSMIAQRIRKMVNNPEEQITDPATGELRPIRYGDIVILLRSMKNRTEKAVKVLTDYGIPAYTESRSGYFQAREIQTILDYLRILDNPRQDIPMASVLHSPIGGFSSEDMAVIRGTYPELPFSMAVLQYGSTEAEKAEAKNAEAKNAEMGNTEPTANLRSRLQAFLQMAETHRRAIHYTPLHQLIRRILKDTGYGLYLSALEGNVRREANVEMLIQKAKNFEEISYKGIFHFLRYLKELQDQEVDFGEANVAEELDSVRILSSHKSKGLEFPVVFLAELGGKLRSRSAGSLVMHSTYGMAISAMDPKTRIKSSTLCRKLLMREKDYEEIGEEIRILYVAMTRAREKMILTGNCTKLEEKLTGWQARRWEEGRLSVGDIMHAGTSLDLIMPAVLREDTCFEVIPVQAENLTAADMVHAIEEVFTEERFAALEEEVLADAAVYNESLLAQLQSAEQIVYPYSSMLGFPVKVSVSDVKMKHIQEMEEEQDSESVFVQAEAEPLVPKFLKEQEEVGGAQRGTAYHRFLECYDYLHYDSTLESVRRSMQQQITDGLLTEEAADLIRPRAMCDFLESEIGCRMRRAAESGVLKREQMFMLGIPGSRIYGSEAGDELCLMQGIIDAFFEEDGELILVDYKTDRVNSAEELRDRYALQLEYYTEALERLTGRRVREKLLYSFALQRVVPV